MDTDAFMCCTDGSEAVTVGIDMKEFPQRDKRADRRASRKAARAAKKAAMVGEVLFSEDDDEEPDASTRDGDGGGDDARDELTAGDASSLQDALKETALSGFYSTVQYRLVEEAGAGQRTLSMALLAESVVAMAMLLLSVVALNAVWIVQSANFAWDNYLEDDAYMGYLYPRGTSQPSRTAALNFVANPLYFGVPAFVFVSLLATAFAITVALEKTVESLIISAGLLQSTFFHDGTMTLPKGAAAWVYVALAFLVQQLRLLLALVMVEQTIQIVGTSDGPLNILLNATALMFLLALDEGFGIGKAHSVYGDVFAGRDDDRLAARRKAGSLGPCPLDRVAKTIYAAPGLELQPLVQALSLVGIALTVIVGEVAMQRHTSKAEIVIADDFVYELHPSVANTYQVCQLAAAIILCIVVNWSAYYATRNLKLTLASLVLDFLVLQVIYIVLYEWVIGQLLWFGKSAASSPLIWGAQRIYRNHGGDAVLQTGSVFGGSDYDGE